jgi:hypothetical protein
MYSTDDTVKFDSAFSLTWLGVLSLLPVLSGALIVLLGAILTGSWFDRIFFGLLTIQIAGSMIIWHCLRQLS